MKKRLISLGLAVLMLCSIMCTSAFATGSEAKAAATSPVYIADLLNPTVTTHKVNGLTVEEVAPLDLTGIDPLSITEIPSNDLMTAKATSKADPLPVAKNISISSFDFGTAISLDETSQVMRTAASSSYALSSVSNVMGDGETQQLYTVTVPSGDIVQAVLQVPTDLSLNYTLYLCTLDAANANLMIESHSAYATNSNFMDETVCAINNSAEDVVYYIVIDSNGNPSTEAYYTLSVSTGGTPDAFEPNDSGFYAFDFPEMSNTTTITVPGSLHTPIDNDWFGLYVGSVADFAGLEISGLPSNVVVESYTFTADAQPTLTGSTAYGNTLPLIVGYNYFRIVYNYNGPFVHTNYNIKFAPALNVQKIITLIAVDGYCQRKSNLFSDGVTRYLFTRSADVEVKVLYATANDIMVKTNDTVSVTIDNPQWTAESMRYKRGSSTISWEDTCIVSLVAPTTYGTSTYNQVYTTIISSNYGTLANHVQMALLDHYDDGELNRPCDHNGTCGYM